ncbi:hypothetical protein SLA2020_049380 [Shorea laevis]
MKSASPQNKSSSTDTQILTNTHNLGSGKLGHHLSKVAENDRLKGIDRLKNRNKASEQQRRGKETEVWREGGIAEQICKSQKSEIVLLVLGLANWLCLDN